MVARTAPQLVMVILLYNAGWLAAQERQSTAKGSGDTGRAGASVTSGGQQDAGGADVAKRDGGPEKVIRTEKEWRQILSREQYKILRQKGTERPFRNKYDEHFEPGTYACAACGQELFPSTTKFNSGCGWPAFFATLAGDRVILKPDFSLGMVRTEVICARCDSHLGHVFADAPQTPTGNRFCINSVSLKFIPAETPEGARKKDADQKSNRSGKSSSTRERTEAGKSAE